MVKVYKDYNDIPPILQSEKAIALLKEAIETKESISFINNKEIRDKLAKIYHNKCAYCESSFEGQIEIYRPMKNVAENKNHKGYYWLATEWSNLLIACPVCDRIKGNHFPIENEANRVFEPEFSDFTTNSKPQFLANKPPLIDEKPLLLNPEIDEPKEHLFITKDGKIHGKTERGTKTIEILGLNREMLIIKRLKVIEDIRNAINSILVLLIQNKFETSSIKEYLNLVFDTIKQKSKPEEEYSLVGYYMLNNFDDFFISDLEVDSIKELFRKAFEYYNSKVILINDFSETVYTYNDKILPYSIKQIQIENFRGIKKTGIKDIPVDAQWIFLAGNNGAGKTSVLQSIALGLWGKADTLDNQFNDSNIGIEFTIQQKNIINILNDTSNFTPFLHFVAYGPSRLTMQSASASNEEIEESSKTFNIFNDNGMLLNIESELSRWSQIEKFKQRYEDIKDLLIEILNINDIKVDERNYKKLLYQEKDEDGEGIFDWLEFKNLASGYRSLIGMIGDMLLRFYKIEENTNKKPKDIAGIVLIDELDLHLHPKWQKRLVEVLTSTFRKMQFIVSTHSFVPLLGAPQNSVLLKVNRNIEEGIFIERIFLDIKKLLPETILTSELFDFKTITHKDLSDFTELRTEYTYNEILFNDEVKRRLKDYAQKESYPTDLFD